MATLAFTSGRLRAPLVLPVSQTSSWPTTLTPLIGTDHLPATERLAFWREAVAPFMGRLEWHTTDESTFWARLHYGELGAVRVRLVDMTDLIGRRTPALIGRSAPDLLTLVMPVRGRGVIRQNGRQVGLRPGEFALVETLRPFEVRTVGRSDVHRNLALSFPRELLPLPSGQIRRLTAVRIGAGRGVGALTSGFLMQLARGIDHYHPGEAARLSTAALDVLATRLAHELDGDGWVPFETRKRALLSRVYAFIQEHLGDAELSPGTIAAAHHISVRYLHKLFSEQGQTVASWIRARRLECCRRDLADPTMADRPVAAVGARWGFGQPGGFSRAFKAAYGLTPLEYRQHTR